jgi:transposase
MLDQAQRTAILELHRQGLGVRAIAKAMGIGRGTARRVIRSGSSEVPRLARPEKAAPHRERILELVGDFKPGRGEVSTRGEAE